MHRDKGEGGPGSTTGHNNINRVSSNTANGDITFKYGDPIPNKDPRNGWVGQTYLFN